jgi:hypothetical protein
MKELPPRLRGLNTQGPQPPLVTEATFRRFAEWGVNVVRINLKPDTGIKPNADEKGADVPPAMQPYRVGIARLDRMAEMARARGIYLIPCAAGLVGRDQKDVAEDGTAGQNRSGFADHLVAFWEFMARRYRDNPAVIGYDLLNEPHTKWEVAVWREELAPRVIRAIRAIDANTWLVFEPGPWGLPGAYDQLTPLTDPRPGEPRIMYSFHFYAPHNYTHQGIRGKPREGTYPGMLQMFPTSPVIRWDAKHFRKYVAGVVAFKERYGVRMFVGEFGVVRWAPGAATWVKDAIGLFEDVHFDWAFHSYAGWNGWNPTFAPGAPADGKTDGGYESEPLKVLEKNWARNAAEKPTAPDQKTGHE